MKNDVFEYKNEAVTIDLGVLGDQIVTVEYVVWHREDGSKRIRIVMVLFREETLHEYEVMKLEDLLIDIISSTQPDEE